MLNLLLTLIITNSILASNNPDSISSDTWSGIMIPAGKSYTDAQVLWLKLPKDWTNSDFQSLSRQETYQTEFFAVHKLSFKNQDSILTLEESKAIKKKLNRATSFCRMRYTVRYDNKTGYLKGDYLSLDCRTSGTVILYKSSQNFSEENAMSASHAWVGKLIDDLKAGKLSPNKLKELRENFVFEPLYFDFDKDYIRDEYKEYLKLMALVVASHSDLRIKVTGHTDGDGSDAYNLNLSKRRALAIENFFVSQGLSKDRIVIDFRGKREPVASNKTSAGKQLNRRVDFSFI